MILNSDQQAAVINGKPVTLNVAGTECVLIRRDLFLRLDPDFETGPWTIEEMNMLADEADEIIESAPRPQPMTQEEWVAFILATAGSVDDPTFERPPQGDYEERESLP